MSMKDLPAAAWATIWRWTAILTTLSVAASVAVSHVLLSGLSQGLSDVGLAAAVLLPVLLGGPMTFWHLVRVQQLKLANERLQVLASTDWLTASLNRRAFTQQVSARLASPEAREGSSCGALLVIDADHFKLVNDLFGHDHGDAALQRIAEVIRAKVRENDLVCRMGGEEFGVFLDGADAETAGLIAERIRYGVNRIDFAPHGEIHPLSVSIGAAMSDGTASFSDLFRTADQHLYAAKRAGRNRCRLAEGRPRTPPAPAAAGAAMPAGGP